MKRVEMYVAEDGKVFINQSECQIYEAHQKLLSVNASAEDFSFETPMTTMSTGDFIVFHSSSKEEYEKMKDYIRNNSCWDNREIYDDENVDGIGNFIVSLPHEYGWADILPYKDVIDGLRTMLNKLENWHA